MQMMVKEILHQWNYTESPKNENLPPCWGKEPDTEHETSAKKYMYAFT